MASNGCFRVAGSYYNKFIKLNYKLKLVWV